MSTTNNSINSPIPTTVPNGGSGRSSGTTAYAPICVGTTATGPEQTADTGLSTSGFVFTSNGASALPSFQTVGASAAGLVFIATGTASSSASIEFKNVFTSTYDNYCIIFENVIPATSTAVLYTVFGYGATPTYSAASYLGNYLSGGGGVASSGSTGTTNVALAISQSTTYGISGSLWINGANNGTAVFLNGITNGYQSAPVSYMLEIGAFWYLGQVLTSMKFLMSAGNIASGTFKLYGYHN